MKRIFIAILTILALPTNSQMQAQTVNFSKYFEDATLRIDYYRAGNRQSDTIVGCYDERLPIWPGSYTQLIDPFDNGHFRIVVKDARRGNVIYTRHYNSLFNEYRDTPEGKDSIAMLEEVVRVPWPKNPVDICWEERGANGRYFTLSVLRYDPQTRLKVMSQREYTRRVVTPLKLQYMGDVHSKMDVVIVPEGYGPADSVKMINDMYKFMEYMLAQEPFNSRRSDFNVWGIPITGKASGITDPNKGIAVKSLVGASYNTFGADRYLMTMNLFRLHDVIGDTPCDHIIIMANSDTYGGGAIYNFYAISSLNQMAPMVLPHELGHSIGGLADEYVDENLSYGGMHKPTEEPMEPNITTLIHFDQKWESMLPAGTPVPTPDNNSVKRSENGPMGAYEGAGYHAKDFYRPVMHCMMRDYAPFCPVCAKRLNQVFDLYTR